MIMSAAAGVRRRWCLDDGGDDRSQRRQRGQRQRQRQSSPSELDFSSSSSPVVRSHSDDGCRGEDCSVNKLSEATPSSSSSSSSSRSALSLFTSQSRSRGNSNNCASAALSSFSSSSTRHGTFFSLAVFVSLLVLFSSADGQRQNLPDLSETSSKPIRVQVGDDINIDCVVKNRNNLTILWKYVNGTQDTLISANMVIVTDDKRVSVTHDSASERWVLQIKYARLQDTGIYRCVVNSNPNVYETRMVMVSVRKTYADVLKAATTGGGMAGSGGNSNGTTSITDRSFYECCQTEGVPILCRPLCNLNAMISDQTKPYMYTLCYNYMAHIFRCIADGRNHLPCCQRQLVPTLCQPSCTGRYSLEKALDHAICHEHSKTILFCIADGLQVLPEQPQDVSAETVNFTFISLKWSSPKESVPSGTEYKITLKELATFDENWKKANVTLRIDPPKIETLIVSGNATEKLLGPLKKSTMYEIKMIARNKFGESMPTNEIRVVTHSPPSPSSSSSSSSTSSMTGEAGEEGSSGSSSRKKVVDDLDNGKAGDPAQVPNLRRCCSAKGVKSDACLKQLCEPFIIEPVEVEESIMCMKYMNTSYKCIEEIRDNTDYETCCEEEGVSAFCKHFCSGKTALLYDFQSQFQCLPYMSSLVSCVLERKGYVTTEPTSVAVSSVHTDWALVMWKPPKKQADTVTKYQVHYRELSEEADDFYFVEVATKSPFLVDKLRSSTRYEVFVTAVNKYGVSRGSTRILFNTTSAEPDPLLDQNLDMPDTSLGYNETMCCEKAGVQPTCLPLCDYHLKMKDLFKLSLFCAEPKTARSILRCLAGGRDHRPCCERRGIDAECFDLCNGMITFTSRDVAAKCSKYDGKIFQCMAEGADTLPGMPLALHAANITATSIGIAWNRSLDELPVTDPTTYQIRYAPLPANTTIPPHPFDDKYSTKLNVSNTRFTLTNLKPNTSYSIYVVSSNQYGNSAPSQVLLVSTAATAGTSSESVNGSITAASIGPPHGLELIRKSITVLVFRWSEPHYSAPDVTFTYNIFFQKVKTLTGKDQQNAGGNSNNNSPANHSAWIMMNSNTNVIAIQNLTRNTQYAIAVRARTSTGQLSPISETVLAWTDPSLPLEISQPFIHPFPVIEGSMVTIRCESIGYPVPNMTIYINGLKTKSERTRIVHYSIDYVERNLTAIACQAVNEESRHPVQSFREVNVHFAPTITLYKETKIAQKFSIVMLECEFSGYPKPKTRFLRDNALVSRFNNSRVFPHLKKPKTWVATLVLHNVDQTAAGNYDCIARNDYGEEKKTLRLMIEDTEHVPKNHTECCQEKGIPAECMFVCTKKDINLFDVYKNQKCLEHLNKYITCAADGSDHRRCCMFREVAPECLHWCAGYKIQKMDYCLVSSARDIMSCFREGNKFLPSPPVNVRVQTIFSDNHVTVEWEDAEKNREATHWYWVYWKKVGTNEMDRDRVEGNAYQLATLEPDATYEFVVKTSNYHGTSILSEPLVINLGSLRRAAASLRGSEGAMLGSAFFTLFLLLLLFSTVGLVAYLTYRRSPELFAKFRGANSSCTDSLGVSFENHAYSLEEQNGGIQLQEQNHNNGTANGVGGGGSSNGTVMHPSNGSAGGGGGSNGHTGNGDAGGGLFPNQHPSDQNNNPNARNGGGQPRVQIRMN